MATVPKHADFRDSRNSFSAATFRKVLKGFEMGGLPYTEVEFQLKRLLATGVPPGELREVLRRCELIEPLPEYAYRQVADLLDEAIEQQAAMQPDPEGAIEEQEELDPAKLSAELQLARDALESEHTRVREAEEALSERIASEEAARSRLDTTLRESERHQADLRAARNTIANRDKVTAQMRQTLDQRDAELAAMRAELEAERNKSRESERSLTDSNSLGGAALASRDKALAEVRQALASRDKTLAELRQSLAERDAQLATLGQRHTKAMAESEGRTQKTEEKLQAAQKRVTAANADLDNLRAQVAGLQSKLRDSNALIEKLGASVRSEAKRSAQWQAAAQQRESTAAQTLPREELRSKMEFLPPLGAEPPAEVLPRVDVLRNFRTMPRAVWIGAAIVLLVAIWLIAHRPSPAPSKPVVAKAAVIPPGTTIRDCPTCPVLTVLPTGRFEQGSAPAENSSTFEKPLHWVMIAHPIALSTNAVTVDQFREFVAATGRDMQGCETYDGDWRNRTENNWESPGFEQTGSHPVTCTSWNDAKAYAVWLSAKTGQHYRLPSASEWEYAARAGGAAAQPWGAESSDACANANVADQSAAHRYPGWTVFACDDGYVQTAPVGSFKANSFGLNDMLGNVFQWTEDCWNPDYKGAPIDGAARTDGNCAERELRGGSWFSNPNYVRANYRNHFGADYRTSTVGIRLARDIAP